MFLDASKPYDNLQHYNRLYNLAKGVTAGAGLLTIGGLSVLAYLYFTGGSGLLFALAGTSGVLVFTVAGGCWTIKEAKKKAEEAVINTPLDKLLDNQKNVINDYLNGKTEQEKIAPKLVEFFHQLKIIKKQFQSPTLLENHIKQLNFVHSNLGDTNALKENQKLKKWLTLPTDLVALFAQT